MSWHDFLAQHPVGDVIEGVVTKQVPFGSFVESEGLYRPRPRTVLAGRYPRLGPDPRDRSGTAAIQPGSGLTVTC
jgi:hypothetical protein